MALTKEAFLSKFAKPKVRKVELADGEPVFVRVMTLAEREQLEKLIDDDSADKKKRATLLAFTLCDEEGKRLFEVSDVQTLADVLPADYFSLIWQEAWDFNCLGQKQLEALKKSSASAALTGGDSSSA